MTKKRDLCRTSCELRVEAEVGESGEGAWMWGCERMTILAVVASRARGVRVQSRAVDQWGSRDKPGGAGKKIGRAHV